MGEVYRARDTKLDRDVALKVLPQAFTDDPDRLARFEREAKVLASLNHPNIGHIYGLEEAEGQKDWSLSWSKGRRWPSGSSRDRFRLKRRYPSPSRSPRRLKPRMSRGLFTVIYWIRELGSPR